MAETQTQTEGRAEALARLLGEPDWYAEQSFYRSRIRFGENDYADIVLLPGHLVDKALGLVQIVGEIAEAFRGADDAEAGFRMLLELADEECRSRIWELIEELVTCCVESWELSQMAREMGLDGPPRHPGADAPAVERLEFVKGLPLRMLVRIVMGVAIQAGNG